MDDQEKLNKIYRLIEQKEDKAVILNKIKKALELGIDELFAAWFYLRDKIEFDYRPKDQVVKCIDCNQDGVWTFGEIYFYRDRSLDIPIRCPLCRHYRKQEKKQRS